MHSKVEHESENDEPVFYLLISNKYIPVLARVKKYLELFCRRYHLIRHYCGHKIARITVEFEIANSSLLGSKSS